MDRLGAAVRGELARFGPQGGLAELVERWPGAVGEAIARNAWPARVSRDGTLVANTADSVWAFELGQQAAEIAARLGVPGVRFVPGPLALDAAPPQARAALEPSAEQQREAAAIASEIEDDDLRQSVERAVSLSLVRSRSDRRV